MLTTTSIAGAGESASLHAESTHGARALKQMERNDIGIDIGTRPQQSGRDGTHNTVSSCESSQSGVLPYRPPRRIHRMALPIVVGADAAQLWKSARETIAFLTH